ncbi:SDR family NAD(P)-dependent oxidoreductase [Neisseria shayeganii]|uniref:Short-chain dehydrogenase/reductase SDR n=1 Tax=Neisseria shayeganii 871 TaxID=1032488 RepID=G4CL61_9NEIS|nr:SDR family NAD(P)-dependent oxidoreductase [Neisseria shayeganii]EGY51443.1 short-chain dehydrogenase/reductase SDR [Neisseria shayeganii 871]
MAKTLIIFGYGSGISAAMARHFGREGFAVALVARNEKRLATAVADLQAMGITAQAFAADLAEMAAAQSVVGKVRSAMGNINVLHWNAYTDIEGSLLDTPAATLQESLNVRVVSFIAAVQAALPDLQASGGAVLATGGIMAQDLPAINDFAQNLGALAVSVAAQHKATALLSRSLAPHGVYAGEIIVNGFVHGSAGAAGETASVYPADVAERFWQMYCQRSSAVEIIGAMV